MPTSSRGFCSTPGTVLLPACTRREGCGRVVREIALQVWCRCSDRGQPGDGAACAGQRRRSRAGSRGLGLLSWRQGRWLGSDEPDGCVQGAAAFTAGPLAAALSPLACTPSPLTTLMACLTVCMAPLTACIIETGIGGRGTCWLHCCCHHTARVAVPPAAEAGESPSCLIPLPPPTPCSTHQPCFPTHTPLKSAMTSVVEPQKQAPTGQTEGKHAEAIEGVVTLPLAEVRGLAGRGSRPRLSRQVAPAAPPPPPHPHVAISKRSRRCSTASLTALLFLCATGQGEALWRDGVWPGEQRRSGGAVVGWQLRGRAGHAGRPQHTLQPGHLSQPVAASNADHVPTGHFRTATSVAVMGANVRWHSCLSRLAAGWCLQSLLSQKAAHFPTAAQVNKATFVRVDYAGDLEEAINRQVE